MPTKLRLKLNEKYFKTQRNSKANSASDGVEAAMTLTVKYRQYHLQPISDSDQILALKAQSKMLYGWLYSINTRIFSLIFS